MNDKILFLLLVFIFSLTVNAQEITETNSDIVYQRALEAYKNGDFAVSLKLTNRGLELAPEYHDIRILQIRNLWALEEFITADSDLDYLLKEAPDYVDMKSLVYQRINIFENNKDAFNFIERLLQVYPEDIGLKIRKAQVLLKDKKRKEARALAMELIGLKGISGADRYILQALLTRTVSDEIGLNYQYINFSEDYSRNDSWNSISAEYQHNFNRTAVIGRVNYADRSYEQGTLYELEAYPVFNDRLYAFTNIGFSNGELFPTFRGSLSVFYNFAKVFEAEAGGRLQKFNENNFYTGIIGLTLYNGKFYLNARAFLGPEINQQFVRNYQGNIRYYLTNNDNYLSLRVGNGISPDERLLSTQALENPLLNAYYGTLGVNFNLGVHNLLQISAGVLYEDITIDRQGTQFISSLGYRYRF